MLDYPPADARDNFSDFLFAPYLELCDLVVKFQDAFSH